MSRRSIVTYAAALAALLIFQLRVAGAQTEPFGGKTITIYVGNPAGGGYDTYGRLVARHIGRHLPGNPHIVVSNMPGAASIVCANYLYNVAPRDGTALGVLAQNFAEEQLFGAEGVRFDAAKFNWIGRISSNYEMAYVWHTVPVKTIDDLKKRETIFSGAGPSGLLYPTLLNKMIGTRFKLVRGYNSTPEAHLAMQRGEVEGASTSLNTVKATAEEWLRTNKINVLVQYALNRHPELPNVPAVIELGSTPDDNAVLAFFASSSAIGRAIIAPPEIPADRLQMIRTAFDATMKDEQLIAEARQARIELDPLTGSELQKLAEKAINLPSAERERARAFRVQP